MAGGVVVWAVLLAAAQGPALTLSPGEGPAGAEVVASGSCPGAGEVGIYWDRKVLVATAQLDPSTQQYTTTFVVPTDATLGSHDVSAECPDAGTVSDFVVTLPSTPTLTPTTRPTVTPRPRLVSVPDVTGRPISEASELLGDDLVLGRVTGNGDLIERQSPRPGTRVRRGSAVNVSLTGSPPQDLVAVPQLLDKSLADARSIVPAARLVLANDTGGEGTIVSQSPVAGTLVPPGSEITVALTTESVSLVERSTPFVAGVLVLLGAAWLLLRPFRRRGPRWVRNHVDVRPSEDQPGWRAELREPRDGPVPTVAISFETRRGSGSVAVKEHADE